jgi:thioredoxin reductase (NADPH)
MMCKCDVSAARVVCGRESSSFWIEWPHDVRSGNVKRVASAVGEGAIAVHMVHEFLEEV